MLLYEYIKYAIMIYLLITIKKNRNRQKKGRYNF